VRLAASLDLKETVFALSVLSQLEYCESEKGGSVPKLKMTIGKVVIRAELFHSNGQRHLASVAIQLFRSNLGRGGLFLNPGEGPSGAGGQRCRRSRRTGFLG